MASAEEALRTIVGRWSNKHIINWTTKLSYLEDSNYKTLSRIRWTFFALSCVGIAFGFSIMQDLVREIVNEHTLNVAALIEVCFFAWIVGKVDNGMHVLSIDLKFRREVGDENIKEKYQDVLNYINRMNKS